MTSALTRRLYAIAWLILGAIALVYLFGLYQSMQGPQTASGPASPFARSPLAENDTGPADPALSQALARMSSEIENLKSALESARQENTALKAHVRTLEATYGPTTAALPPEPETPARNISGGTEMNQPAQKHRVEITMLSMPQDGFDDTFHEAPLPIANLEKPRRTRFAVELASGLKTDAVQPRWDTLSKRHGKLLAALQPRRVTDGESGTYKLIAGPFDNAADAALLCARLSAAGTKCEGTVFTGAPIGDVAAR